MVKNMAKKQGVRKVVRKCNKKDERLDGGRATLRSTVSHINLGRGAGKFMIRPSDWLSNTFSPRP